MEWYRADVSLKNHRKTRRLARSLGVAMYEVIGYLHSLWMDVAQQAEDGVLSGWSDEDIADAAGFVGDPKAFVTALICAGGEGASGFLDDCDEVLVCHGWDERNTAVLSARERKRRQRERDRRHKEEREDPVPGLSADGPRTVTALSRDSHVTVTALSRPTNQPTDKPTDNTYPSPPQRSPEPKPVAPAAPAGADAPDGTSKKGKASKKKPKSPKPKEPPGPNVWAEWVDANRTAGRPDPAPAPQNTSAGKRIGALLPDETERKDVLARYLRDGNPWLVGEGHALRHLEPRIDAYRTGQKPPRLLTPQEREEERSRKLMIEADARRKQQRDAQHGRNGTPESPGNGIRDRAKGRGCRIGECLGSARRVDIRESD